MKYFEGEYVWFGSPRMLGEIKRVGKDSCVIETYVKFGDKEQFVNFKIGFSSILIDKFLDRLNLRIGLIDKQVKNQDGSRVGSMKVEILD